MVSPVTTAKIFATLGNNSSLVPLGIKDVSNSLGITAGSYITGDKVEGKDRFIDEFGTQAIWLLGIPFFKKIIDNSVYKIAKINSKVDPRLLENKEMLKIAIEKAPTKEIKKSIAHAADKIKFTKGLALAKFFVSTGLTLASYFALTQFRHKHTEKTLMKQFKKEYEQKKANQEFLKEKTPTAFSGVVGKESKKQVSFTSGSAINALKMFMFDPVRNTMIIDGGITTERLSSSRNPQDFMGYAIKEGTFWLFMYGISHPIQKFFEKRAAKKNKSIDLDIRVLQDEGIQKEIAKLNKEKIEKLSEKINIKEFKALKKEDFANKKEWKKAVEKQIKEKKKNNAEIYEKLFTNEDNLIVKIAKKSEVIETIDKENGIIKIGKKLGIIKETKELKEAKIKAKIDTQKFIDMDNVRTIKQKLLNITEDITKHENLSTEDFFNQVIQLKRGAIIKNIGACIAALGVVVPAAMVAVRFLKEGNKEFMVKKQVEEKMKKQMIET